MRWWFLGVFAACAATVACVKSSATACGDYVCPVGLSCAQDRCVDPAVLTSCSGHAEGEACDLGAGGIGTCQGGLCIVGRCGDGIINGVEECDSSNVGSATCLDFGAPQAAGLSCGSDCALDPAGCTAYCGNGHVDGTEQCDGSDFAQKSCVDYGFYGGTLSCTTTCAANLGQCAGKCGDGVIEQLEPCDGTNLAGKTCASLGYKGTVRPLTCTAACAFDASSCTCGGVLCPTTQQCVVTGGISSCQ